MYSEHGKSQHALVLKSKSTTPLKLYKGFRIPLKPLS